MKLLVRSVIVVVLTIFAVHAIAYGIIGILPDPSVVALGIFSAQDSAVEAFRTSYQIRTYSLILHDLIVNLDLGNTLDRVPVISEISRALGHSLPRIICACFLMSFAGFSAGFYKEKKQNSWWDNWFVFGIFLPAFFLPLFIFSLLILTGFITGNNVQKVGFWIGCVMSMAIPPVLLINTQSKMVMGRLLTLPFARRYRSIGFSESKVRLRLIKNVADETAPTAEKLVTAMLTQVILAETIFGMEGIGTITVRAVRRTDINLLLGIVLLFASIIGLIRLSSILFRVHNRGWR